MKQAAAVLASAFALIVASVLFVLNSQPAKPTYVIGGQGADSAYWLVLVECSSQPTSWRTAEAYCDMPHVRAISVGQEEYDRYSQGDQYP